MSEGADSSAEQIADEPERYIAYDAGVLASLQGTTKFAMYFHSDWCPPCVELDAMIREKQYMLPSSAIIVHADYDSNFSLRQKYGVQTLTTIVFIDEYGQKVDQIVNPSFAQLEAFFNA